MSSAAIIQHFAAFVALLLEHLARFGHRRQIHGLLLGRIWNRIRAIQHQAGGLVARAAAGQTRRYPHRRPPRPSAGPRRPATPALPTGRAWLVRLIPETARAAPLLQVWLARPEVAAMLDTVPQLRRALRPLCVMLGAGLPAAPQATPRRRTAPRPPAGPRASIPRPVTALQAAPRAALNRA